MEVDGVEPTTLCLQSRCSSQLSYTPEYVVLSRLELLTPTLSVWCSNQLSYRTVMELCMARNTLDLLFQVLHLLYGYRQSVDKEQSKSTR